MNKYTEPCLPSCLDWPSNQVNALLRIHRGEEKPGDLVWAAIASLENEQEGQALSFLQQIPQSIDANVTWQKEGRITELRAIYDQILGGDRGHALQSLVEMAKTLSEAPAPIPAPDEWEEDLGGASDRKSPYGVGQSYDLQGDSSKDVGSTWRRRHSWEPRLGHDRKTKMQRVRHVGGDESPRIDDEAQRRGRREPYRGAERHGYRHKK